MGSKKVDYDSSDDTYYGAKGVVEKELEYIRLRRGSTSKTETDPKTDTEIKDLSGLALSGGGIRSASFSLGVMQALAHNGWLKKIDYLSTVSGGGYAGSSLSWLLSKHSQAQTSEDNNKNANKATVKPFGVSADDFPYGTYPISGAYPDSHLPTKDSEDTKPTKADQNKGKLLRYLRQQATYLTPGDGINALSLIAIILRGALMSLFVYFGLLILAFVLIYPLLSQTPGYFEKNLPLGDLNLALWLAIAGGVLFAGLALVYSVGTYFWSRRKRDTKKPPTDNTQPGRSYRMRQLYERSASSLLSVILILLVLGAVPGVYEGLQQALTDNTVSDFSINGTQAEDGSMQFSGSLAAPIKSTNEPSKFTALIGVFSALFGALSGVMAFFKSSSGKKGRLPMGLVVTVGTAALWFGLLLVAYFSADWMWGNHNGGALLSYWITTAVLVYLVGRLSNINYLSIHRYYRDRLMETFMPDVEKAFAGDIATRAVTRADKMPIHALLNEGDATGLSAKPAPYHLINTNVVLESSNIPKFRGRGGDNFILSPLYCGSNATSWLSSDEFMDGRMTLPTAMAISGAAVNPSTGVGGQGVTRQPLLSMFMGLLNIRLGYWAPNPSPGPKPKTDTDTDTDSKLKAEEPTKSIPNFLHPGLCEMFRRSKLNEEADYVQLTDGGHFENLALYELIRRRAKLIIACDGGADPDFQFTDFANMQEKVRADFGALIHCNCHDLQTLVPHSTIKDSKLSDDAIKYAERGYLMRVISYPDNSQGRLLYIKTTFFEKLSADLYGYKKTHPQFPDEPTSDQFFDEMQFEAYRELGFQTAWHMMQDEDILNDACVKDFIDKKVN